MDLSTTNRLEKNHVNTATPPQSPYLQALLDCSFALLSSAKSEAEQQHALNEALEPLRIASQSCRAYVFRNFKEPEFGDFLGMLAETCAPGIIPHIENPYNRKVSWSIMPEEMYNTLGEGKPYGGPVERSIASKPALQKNFLEQDPPLLSFQCFPILMDEHWWGFIGFDDCETARDWDDEEILMLRTASEMIGNTLRRWVAEGELLNTLSTLEKRVEERTIEYAEANAQLRWEIHERERFQTELENRIGIESTLAGISTRLLSQVGLKIAIQETLQDLGRMIQATHVLFVSYAETDSTEIEDRLEWRKSAVKPTKDGLIQILDKPHNWFRRQLESNQSVFINDLSKLPPEAKAEKSYLEERYVHSLVLLPLFQDDRMLGVLVCSNIELPGHQIAENLPALEVIASMISSLLQRETLLNTLELQVAARTRELSIFLDMAMLIGETDKLADILQPALSKVMEVSSCEAACIHLVSEQGDVLKLVAQRGIPSDQKEYLRSIYIDDTLHSGYPGTDPWKTSETSGAAMMPDITDLPGFHTSQFAKLHTRDKTLGILSCYRVANIPFTPFQISMLNAIGEQLGVVVENFHLHQQTEALAIIQERQRLARDLHDAVSQSIYSLMLFARSGKDALEEGDQRKLAASLQQLEDNATTALKEMRLLLYQLRSPLLEQDGLNRAIEARFDLVERKLGITCFCEIYDAVRLPSNIEQEVFRIVSESLNNSLKHAKATQVRVSIQPEGEDIIVNISDNGDGFDPARISPGMGLNNISERVAGFGGELKITSQLGGGTQVCLSIPQQVLQEDRQEGS